MELKSGETYNGVLVNVDHWMNLNLTKVTCTSREGDKFWKMSGIYIKGSMIKYMSIPEEVLAMTPDELPQEKDEKKSGSRSNRGGGRGGRGGIGGHKDKDSGDRASSSHSGKSERGGRGGGGRGHSDSARGANRVSGTSNRGNRGGQYKPRGSSK